MRTWTWLSVLAFSLVFSSVAFAADPPKLLCEPRYGRDKQIVLSLQGIECEKPIGEIYVRWTVRRVSGGTEPNTLALTPALCLAVWAGPGKYEALATVAVPNWTEKKLTWHELSATFEVVEGIGPPPPPTSGDFKDLSDKVVELSKPIVSKTKQADAELLANLYRKHGKLAIDGKYENAEQLADACTSEYTSLLGLMNYARWRPMLTRLREELSRMMASGRLGKDVKVWGAAWISIGDGLERVSKEESNAEGSVQPK